jgi:hypothetical protein
MDRMQEGNRITVATSLAAFVYSFFLVFCSSRFVIGLESVLIPPSTNAGQSVCQPGLDVEIVREI